MSAEKIDKAIKEVAKIFDISPAIVKMVYGSQFKFVKRRMAELSVRGVRLPRIGLFVLKDTKKEAVENGEVEIWTDEEKQKKREEFLNKNKGKKDKKLED